jgi:hypothetical protein
MSIHQFRPSPSAVELSACHERIEELTQALNGMIGLIVLVSGRDDISPELREVFNNNHRIAAALDAIADRIAS